MGSNSFPKGCVADTKGFFEFPSSEHPWVQIINAFGFTHVAEVGVMSGTLTSRVLGLCPSIVEYYCIDPWVPYIESYHRPHRPEEATKEYWNMVADKVYKLAKKDSRVKIIRKPSIQGVHDIPDRYLSTVYIDAIHDYEHTSEDIHAWSMKVRICGVVSGHDYSPQFKGVIQAADEFFGDSLNVTRDYNWFAQL